MHIVTVDEMRQLERRAESEYGLTSSILMEHAGMSAAEILTHYISRQHTLKEREFLILVGPGNNGGDGMVMGRYLQKWGGIVSYFHWKEQHLTLGEQDVPEQETTAKLDEAFSHADYIIDALLGTGRSRPLPDTMRGLLARAKQERESRDAVRIVAVDLPTGVNADTGEVDPGTIPADLTITLACPKQGFFFFPARSYIGELYVGDIGLPSALEQGLLSEMLTNKLAKQLLPPRSAR